METVNIHADKPEGRLDVARALGSSDYEMFIYDLAPGRSSSPYHYEYTEEWLLVVDGTLVMRAPDGEHTLNRGDLVFFPAGPAGASAGQTNEQALAERYAPVVRLVSHTDCPPGEPYTPIDVNALFDEPTVALRGPWGNDLVKIGPSAEDLAKGLYEYHLDFPGNALDPACTVVHQPSWCARPAPRAGSRTLLPP